MLPRLLVALSALFLAQASFAQLGYMHSDALTQDIPSAVQGGITGFVLTEDGQLVKETTPCTSVRSGNQTTINCRGSVDNEGRFTIEHLNLGTYQVFAINEAEGYSIDNQTPGQDVTVSADQPWPNVTIRLRSRGGILDGSLTDKVTGKTIEGNIEYIAMDGASGGGSMLVKGEFHVTIPPKCEVVLLAIAKGYKGWVYTDASHPSRPVLRLAAGERKLLDIQLEPLPSPSPSPNTPSFDTGSR